MLDGIKSHNIQMFILKYMTQKKVLNIFKYNKNYQSKFNLKKEDYKDEYLIQFYDQIPSLKCLCRPKDETDLFNDIKRFISEKYPYDTLIKKENIARYYALQKNNIIYLNNIYFKEIINEKILLKQKKIKIKLGIEKSYLSQIDIINLLIKNSSIKDIENFIKSNIYIYNYLINNIDILLNSELIIEEFYFDLLYIDIVKDLNMLIIDNNQDILEYNENQTNEDKNILINCKLNLIESLNKLLSKNAKYIKALKYIIFDKKSYNCDLLDVDIFINLEDLNLYLISNNNNHKYKYEFPDVFKNLKKLKINGCYDYCYINSTRLYIKKEILDKLETLKIKKIIWYVLEHENFYFKNIKKLNIECLKPNDKYLNEKYIYDEILNGNIIWEKLKKLKINIPYGDKIEEEFKNKKIIEFINIANLREGYDDSIDFFHKFFKFIFENQILELKTKKKNPCLDEFILKLYGDYGIHYSYYIKSVAYKKKLKNVNIIVQGKIYGNDVYWCRAESPLKSINLNEFKLDSNLDSFLIDGLTISELIKIKEILLIKDKEEDYKTYFKDYLELIDKQEIDKHLRKKVINEINEKIEVMKKNHNTIYEGYKNKNAFEKKVLEIEEVYLRDKLYEIEKIKNRINGLPKLKNKKIQNPKINYNVDIDFSNLDLFD